jgi:HSP20 family molecular chaperone IbpA
VQSLPVTIWETDDAFHAALMAPGLDEDSINVTVQEDTLSVEGELKFQPPEGARMIWQAVRPTADNCRPGRTDPADNAASS